jgi:hypothetical protein
MTDPEPISLEEFTAALESLDRAEFASFVGQLRAVMADEVDVEPPLVTVRTGDTLTELLVGTPDPGSETDPGEIDGIVTRAEEPPDVDVDATSITPSDLRQRLLWGLRVNEAQALCERALGMPAYSTRYAVTPSSAGTTASDPPRQEPASSRTERPVLLVSLVALVVLAAGAGGLGQGLLVLGVEALEGGLELAPDAGLLDEGVEGAGREGEHGRDREPDVQHLGQVGGLAADDLELAGLVLASPDDVLHAFSSVVTSSRSSRRLVS